MDVAKFPENAIVTTQDNIKELIGPILSIRLELFERLNGALKP